MPIPPDQLRRVVVGAIAMAAETSPEEITDGLDLFELGLDSLNLAEILIDIEDGIGAEVPAEVLDRFLDIPDTVTVRTVLAVLSTWDPDGPSVPPGGHGYGAVIVPDGAPPL